MNWPLNLLMCREQICRDSDVQIEIWDASQYVLPGGEVTKCGNMSHSGDNQFQDGLL